MIKILCDRCGRDIKEHGEDVGYIIMGTNINPMKGVVIMQENEFNIDPHFCSDCMNKIKDFIQNRQNTALLSVKTSKIKSNKPEAVTEPKNGEKGRKRIDIGKIMALKNAGWNVGKIADEMGMQPQSVSNAIYQYKKKCESE